MSLIFKNGVPYGGGSGDVEIAWEDYKNLSEEERNNGTTYFVPDFVEEDEDEDDDNSGSGISIEKLSGQEIIIESDKYDSVLVVPEEEITSNTYIISTNENKNFIDNISNSETKDGISFIVNRSNGTITVNGTATDNVNFIIQTFNEPFKQGQKLYISYDSEDSLGSSVYISFNSIHQFGGAFEMDKTAGGTVVLFIVKGATLNNAVVKPVMYECDYIQADKTTRFPVKLKTFEGKTRIFTTSNKTLNVYKGDDEATSMLFNVIPRVEPIRVIDDLTTSAFNGALSANQGMILNRKFGGLRFGVDGDGNYGYYKADDSFVPFKSIGLGNINFTPVGNLDDGPVIIDAPKDKPCFVIVQYTYNPNQNYIAIYNTIDGYGARMVTTKDLKTTTYAMGGYGLGSLQCTKTVLEDRIEFKITPDGQYIGGEVKALIVPLDGTDILKPSTYYDVFDVLTDFDILTDSSGMQASIGKNMIRFHWDGNPNTSFNMNIRSNATLLDNYSKIRFSVSITRIVNTNNGFYFGLVGSSSASLLDLRSDSAINVVNTKQTGNIEFEIDVSSLTGRYHLIFAPMGVSGSVSRLEFIK